MEWVEKEVGTSLLAVAKRHGRTLRELHLSTSKALSADVLVEVVSHCPRLKHLVYGTRSEGSTSLGDDPRANTFRRFIRSVARAAPWLECVQSVDTPGSPDPIIFAMMPRLHTYYSANVDYYVGLCY